MRATRKNALLLVAVLILMISQVPMSVSNDCALAESEAYDYSQIWESFGVNSSEEMYEETLAYLRSQNPGAWAITKEYLPCNIRYGGTTEELLADWKNWDLAVVSSKDVDLRALVERKDLIEKFPVSLTSDIALHQYRVPENLRELLPKSKKWNYRVFFYDYNAQKDEAMMLVVNGKGKGIVEYVVTGLMLENRPAEKIRAIEGLREVTYWTVEDLLAAPNDWDVACIAIDQADKLRPLDEAGLLYNFAQDSYFATREPTQESGKRILAAGMYSDDGRMIGIPYNASYPHEEESYQTVLVNAQSAYMNASIAYARKLVQGWDVSRIKKVTDEDIFDIWGIQVGGK